MIMARWKWLLHSSEHHQKMMLIDPKAQWNPKSRIGLTGIKNMVKKCEFLET
jgi:hypothetical protein